MSSLIVFKLGGSSVSSIGSLQHFSQRVGQNKHRPILVVVSALSKVTDALENYTRTILEQRRQDGEFIVANLRVRHLQMITQLLPGSRAPQVAEEVGHLLTRLETLADSSTEQPAALRDLILPFGEAMSSLIVAAYLDWEHNHACTIDANKLLVTDGCFGTAEPLDAPTLAKLQTEMIPHLQAGNIIVTQGFCGATAAGESTTLGRGGSDFSATYLGALLNSSEIEIRTDTPGVLSADPRVILNTRILRKISHRRASSLAHFGAKVLHQRCIEPVIGTSIAVRVLSSFDPEEPGTLIGEHDEEHAFSVAHCGAWIYRFSCPLGASLESFQEAVQQLEHEPGFLGLSLVDEDAFLVRSSPLTEALLQGRYFEQGESSQTATLFVMSTRLDNELLQEVKRSLQEGDITVSVSFIDTERGGYVLAVNEQQGQKACILAHRSLLRLSKPTLVTS